jgi:hypothetical protein
MQRRRVKPVRINAVALISINRVFSVKLKSGVEYAKVNTPNTTNPRIIKENATKIPSTDILLLCMPPSSLV